MRVVRARERASVLRKIPGSVIRVGRKKSVRSCAGLIAFAVLSFCCSAQQTPPPANNSSTPAVNSQLPVNWLYGAYIPKEAPLVSLNGKERFKLYVRQTYTTPGIYIKTGFFAVHDQIHNSPESWGDGFDGFAKRVGSNQATNIIQNSFTAAGQAAVSWEPRYDRCKCDGGWLRFRHAFVRNFITYDRSEVSLRPNVMPFAAAFGAGVIGATWNPNNPTLTVKGYQNVITQAWVGVITNTIGEFAPDVMKKIKKKKTAD